MQRTDSNLEETEKRLLNSCKGIFHNERIIKWLKSGRQWEKLRSIGYEKKTFTRKRQMDTIIEDGIFLCISSLLQNCLHRCSADTGI